MNTGNGKLERTRQAIGGALEALEEFLACIFVPAMLERYRLAKEACKERAEEIARLRAFAQGALDALSEMGWTDEETIHKLGIEHGLIVMAEVSEPCGEECPCSEWDEFPTTCYRRTELLTGKEG